MKKVFPIMYTIKGITLDVMDLVHISQYYKAACTAEYIYENYKVTEKEALELGYQVRDEMDKYEESTESDVVFRMCRGLKRRHYNDSRTQS